MTGTGSTSLGEISLLDAEGWWAGLIYSNVEDPQDLVQGERCEVIMISAGSIDYNPNSTEKDLRELEYVSEIWLLEKYEFYNILWIKRDGDIAYREALGRVWKEAWHRQEVEEVDILLG